MTYEWRIVRIEEGQFCVETFEVAVEGLKSQAALGRTGSWKASTGGFGCLNREHLHTLTEARAVVGDHRREYNQRRLHSRLGYLRSEGFMKSQRPSPVAVGLHPPSTRDRQANTQQQPSTND